MLCQNCGKNEVSFHYTQIVNGVKKEIALCDECKSKLGLVSLDFNMPIDFSSFLGEFFEDEDMLQAFNPIEKLKCNNCGLTFDNFVKDGKFGCSNCYSVFEEKIDSILKNLHGSSIHTGRKGKLITGGNNLKEENEKEIIKPEDNITKLKRDLKQAIKEEKYEEAAKIRDEIKKIENGQ